MSLNKVSSFYIAKRSYISDLDVSKMIKYISKEMYEKQRNMYIFTFLISFFYLAIICLFIIYNFIWWRIYKISIIILSLLSSIFTAQHLINKWYFLSENLIIPYILSVDSCCVWFIQFNYFNTNVSYRQIRIFLVIKMSKWEGQEKKKKRR